MKFIELTKERFIKSSIGKGTDWYTAEEKIAVSINKIVSIKKSEKGGTDIYLTHQSTVRVKEHYEDIIDTFRAYGSVM